MKHGCNNNFDVVSCPPTFVLVGLGLDAEDGHDGDDNDDGGGGEGHHEPGLAMEGLLLEGAVLQVLLARRGHLKIKVIVR